LEDAANAHRLLSAWKKRADWREEKALLATLGGDLNMEAGRAMDVVVAEKVMGWYDVKSDGSLAMGSPPSWMYPAECCPEFQGTLQIPRYSTDMTAVWAVVERMRQHPTCRFNSLSMVVYSYSRTYATFDAEAFSDYDPDTWAEANGEYATPLAICFAALMAIRAVPVHGPRR
jgi:hypothetical protein